MKKRFVVAVEMTADQEKQFIAFLRSKKMGWWHRVSNFWLITSKSDEVDASFIRDNLRTIGTAKPTSLVMQIHEDIDWAGLFAETSGDTFEWLGKTWLDQPESDPS